MIECVKYNVYYKKKKFRFKKKRFFSTLLIFFIVLLLILFYRNSVYKQLISISCDYAYSYSTEAVNESILNSLSQEIKYVDLVNTEKNQAGEIVYMTTNSFKVNLISREIATATSELLKNKLDKGVPVPTFAFTGIGVFSGYGKPVYLRTLNVSSVVCEFDSQFKSVGVNQTLHSIYVNVYTTTSIELPLTNKVIKSNTSVLINETVLVGKVPEVYLSGDIFN